MPQLMCHEATYGADAKHMDAHMGRMYMETRRLVLKAIMMATGSNVDR